METLEREPVKRLTKDILAAATTITPDEARFLVDAYYIMQEDRKRYGNQERSMEETKEPNSIIAWLNQQSNTLENQIKRALDRYTDQHPAGQWMKSVHGIGPVISAGMLAHIDIRQVESAGQIWRFAGLDPTRKWDGKEVSEKLVKSHADEKDFDVLIGICEMIATTEATSDAKKRACLVKILSRRPWNTSLKTLCWKAGQCFMKFSNDDLCFYGKKYREKKAYYVAENEKGTYREYALQRATQVGKSTEAYKKYSVGKLPDGQIDARARRFAVKLFIAHLFEVWYELDRGKKPPAPYPIAILGHAHRIDVPLPKPASVLVQGTNGQNE